MSTGRGQGGSCLFSCMIMARPGVPWILTVLLVALPSAHLIPLSRGPLLAPDALVDAR